ncbi:DNA-3-methyladenine glycosylase [Blumeria hordei DH14]|uniref:DNA-3-methyladenine glycosylase n=1 Tax=Blumeria graminis f. sp. hordei (strain DH14) TaxID=546991 RepID=N1JDT7_BLUG1|nr:DNA-3-methyladenine glycosylase [Blumeria hordei DH14]
MFPRRSSRLSETNLDIRTPGNPLATSYCVQKRRSEIKPRHGANSYKDLNNLPKSKRKKEPSLVPSVLEDKPAHSNVKNNTECHLTKYNHESKSPTLPIAQYDSTDILEKAIVHLISVEPKLKNIIEQYPCDLFSPESIGCKVEPFKALSCSIISQQVSTAAAKSIQNRFVALFNPLTRDTTHNFPAPSQIYRTSHSLLRTAGLSLRKTEYIKDLAEKFCTGEIDATMLHNAPYEQVYDTLIKVRGLGKWSIEMFACFGLKHIDIFSTGDLGIQKNMAAFVGRDISVLKTKSGKWKYMNESEMQQRAEKFKPYRSVYMWYIWKMSESTDAPGL